MARFEWAQVVAFDGLAKPPITTDEILDTPRVNCGSSFSLT